MRPSPDVSGPGVAAALADLTGGDYVLDTVRFVLLAPLELPRLASPA